MNRETKISLLMKSLSDFYQEQKYIDEINQIVNQESIISLRILDWFITNYSKKIRTLIPVDDFGKKMDVYMHYKLMLKSFNKASFDPFCRKNKIHFYYTDDKYIETSCGQLCFFKWCFENRILDYVKTHLQIIEDDMKNSLKHKKTLEDLEKGITNGMSALSIERKKRQPISIPASRSISKTHIKYTLRFD